MFNRIAEIRKAIATAIGTLLMVLVFVSDNLGGLLPTGVGWALTAFIAVLTTVATWAVANEEPAPE